MIFISIKPKASRLTGWLLLLDKQEEWCYSIYKLFAKEHFYE